MVNVGSNRVYCVYEDRSCTLWDAQNLEDPKIVFEYPAIRGQVRLTSAEMIAFLNLIFIKRLFLLLNLGLVFTLILAQKR